MSDGPSVPLAPGERKDTPLGKEGKAAEEPSEGTRTQGSGSEESGPVIVPNEGHSPIARDPMMIELMEDLHDIIRSLGTCRTILQGEKHQEGTT